MLETPREWIGAAFLLLGCFFALTGAVGVLRMPDFYSRLHPAGKSDTMAQTLILLGLLVTPHADTYGDPLTPVKLVMITLLLYVTAPTATHAITRAAHSAGLPLVQEDPAEEDNDVQ